MTKTIAKTLATLALILGLGIGGLAAGEGTPKRFFVDFTDGYLVYAPGSSTLQITAGGMVLSYGQNWEAKKLKPYLYHLRLKTWKDFFWKVNTSRKEVYKVTDGTFGALGGSETKLDFVLDPKGDANNPDRFLIRFPKSYLVYVPDSDTLQIAAQTQAHGGHVISYKGDWQVKKLKSYLYHLRLASWKNFYWKVNTSRKGIWKVTNGTFGQLGGDQSDLSFGVRVVE